MKGSFGQNKEILKLLAGGNKNQPEAPPPVEVKKKEEKEEAQQSNLPAETIDLKGIWIHEDGTITKTKYFEMLNLDHQNYAAMRFTPDEAKKVSLAIKSMSTGLNAAVPLVCTGPACPFARGCPYFAIDKAPIGMDCLVEKQLINYWTQQYIEEFDVDFKSFTELRMVSELAEFDIYEMRITKYLAEKHPTLLQDVVSFNAQGDEVVNLEISRAFDLKERIKKNRMKVLESLVATRKDKVKINADSVGVGSTAERIVALKDAISGLSKDVANMRYIEQEKPTK